MATKELSNEFMQQVAKDAAWKSLSFDFSWSETLLEKYQDKVDWNEISSNSEIQWTIPMIRKFKRRINWHLFSDLSNDELFTESVIEAFKDNWVWHVLSGNSRIDFSEEIFDKFLDRWDWNEIVKRYDHVVCGIDFFERYKDYIPVSTLQESNLWQTIVAEMGKHLIEEITA